MTSELPVPPRRGFVRQWLGGAWMDEARGRVQGEVFRAITAGHPLRGACLNAGCGEGLYAEFLESFSDVTEIHHVDLTDPTFLRRRPDPRTHTGAADLTRLPYPAESFDSCLCSEVIEHIEDDNQAMAELARVLRPGALLLLSVPQPPAPDDPAHVREGYRPDDLAALARRHGFELVAKADCFHAFMRLFQHLWQWQFTAFGGRRRSWFPRFAVHLFALLDAKLHLGRPWDLVMLFRRQTA